MGTKRSKAGRHFEKVKSLCCVCCRATDHGKVKALLCEGQCQSQKWLQKWLQCYCADVTLGLYEKLSLSKICFTCCQTQHFTELRGKVDLLTFGLSQLIAQLPLTRPQISHCIQLSRTPHVDEHVDVKPMSCFKRRSGNECFRPCVG